MADTNIEIDIPEGTFKVFSFGKLHGQLVGQSVVGDLRDYESIAVKGKVLCASLVNFAKWHNSCAHTYDKDIPNSGRHAHSSAVDPQSEVSEHACPAQPDRTPVDVGCTCCALCTAECQAEADDKQKVLLNG